jgi:UDP-N-acetylmuramate dehydrogenase
MIQKNILLKDYSNYKIGGLAAYFLKVSSKEDFINGIKEWREISKDFSLEQKLIHILSAASNILIDDGGVNGLVIHNNIKTIERKEDLVIAGSGLLVSDFLDFCMENSLSGFEWAGGLPGSIGGAVRGNAGAFGGETKDLVVEVKSIDLGTLEEVSRVNKDCKFGYRISIFKTEKQNEFILSATFKLALGRKEKIKKLISEKIDYRRQKHPMDFPSIGSTFKNIPVETLSDEKKAQLKDYIKNDPMPVVPVAKLLYLAGLKGKRIGNAQVSEKHPNFIVNLGNASSKDVRELINLIKETVEQKFNISLEEEIVYLPK